MRPITRYWIDTDEPITSYAGSIARSQAALADGTFRQEVDFDAQATDFEALNASLDEDENVVIYRSEDLEA